MYRTSLAALLIALAAFTTWASGADDGTTVPTTPARPKTWSERWNQFRQNLTGDAAADDKTADAKPAPRSGSAAAKGPSDASSGNSRSATTASTAPSFSKGATGRMPDAPRAALKSEIAPKSDATTKSEAIVKGESIPRVEAPAKSQTNAKSDMNSSRRTMPLELVVSPYDEPSAEEQLPTLRSRAPATTPNINKPAAGLNDTGMNAGTNASSHVGRTSPPAISSAPGDGIVLAPDLPVTIPLSPSPPQAGVSDRGDTRPVSVLHRSNALQEKLMSLRAGDGDMDNAAPQGAVTQTVSDIPPTSTVIPPVRELPRRPLDGDRRRMSPGRANDPTDNVANADRPRSEPDDFSTRPFPTGKTPEEAVIVDPMPSAPTIDESAFARAQRARAAGIPKNVAAPNKDGSFPSPPYVASAPMGPSARRAPPTDIESSKVTESPKVNEFPRVVESPRVMESPKVIESPKIIESPTVAERRETNAQSPVPTEANIATSQPHVAAQEKMPAQVPQPQTSPEKVAADVPTPATTTLDKSAIGAPSVWSPTVESTPTPAAPERIAETTPPPAAVEKPVASTPRPAALEKATADLNSKAAAEKIVAAEKKAKLEMSLAGPREIGFGQTMIYRLSLSNPGTADAENIVIRLLPMDAKDPGVSHDFGKLAAGELKVVELELVARQVGPVSIRAQAVAAGNLRAEAKQEVQVARETPLQISVRAPQSAASGGVATYTIVVKNANTTPFSHVQVTAQLPLGAKLLGASNEAKMSADETKLAWPSLSIRGGSEIALEVKCRVVTPGPNRLQAEVSGGGQKIAGEAVTRVEGMADLKLEVLDPQGTLAVGQSAIYEIHLSNRGTKAADKIEIRGLFSRGVEPNAAQGAEYEIADGAVNFQPISRIEAGKEVVLKIRAIADRPGQHIFRAEAVCAELDRRLAIEQSKIYMDDPNAKVNERTARRQAPNAESGTIQK